MMGPPRNLIVACLVALILSKEVDSLNVILAGGTGPVGAQVASQMLAADHSITILTRNSFLASSPSRVTTEFGWLGATFLKRHPNVKLRDWDGGDLLDIVGRDWMGWQDDALNNAHCLIHLTGGGFTEQRVMACERLVRETYQVKPGIHHITVNPTNDLLSRLSPGVPAMKQGRIERCEDMVQTNCMFYTSLRSDAKRAVDVAKEIVSAIEEVAASK